MNYCVWEQCPDEVEWLAVDGIYLVNPLYADKFASRNTHAVEIKRPLPAATGRGLEVSD